MTSRAFCLRNAVRWLCCGIAILPFCDLAKASADESQRGQWVPISTAVTDKLSADGKKIGYPELTGGVAVDRANGDVFMVVCDQGLWKSSDQGQTFVRCDNGAIHGRCETPFTLICDPAGKGLATFMVYGKSGTTRDSGTTWQPWKGTSHVDCGAVDWEDSGRALLTIRHESGGVLAFSTDAGQSWTDLGKGFRNGVGLFDARTLVATKGDGILLSDDAGQSWARVSEAKTTGGTMCVWNKIGYWTSPLGLLASHDRGRSWAVQGKPIACVHGPYFGKDKNHILVGTKEGLMETTDGGETWNVAAPFPPGFQFSLSGNNFANFGWDWQRNLIYASSMGKPTYRLQR